MKMQDYHQLIDESTFIKSLSTSQKEDLLLNSSLLKLAKNEMLYNYGDKINSVYIVLEGSVKLGIESKNEKIIIKEIMYAGDLFGENVFVANNTRQEFAKCFIDSTVLIIKADLFKKCIAENPVTANLVTQTIIQRLDNLHQRMQAYTFKNAQQRIIDFIKSTALLKGLDIGLNECLINHGMGHKEIAYLTDTSRQTVARILGELKKDNLIHYGSRKPSKILIRDRDWLTTP
jgi:CRP-like cAMP-binding protein